MKNFTNDTAYNFIYEHADLFCGENRNTWFYHQIKQVAQGQVCMDIGAGSGVMTLFALQCGAKHVYMIEHNFMYYNNTKRMFEQLNIPKNKYTLIYDQFNEYFNYTKEKVNVIISETLSGDLFTQHYQNICRIIKKNNLLKDAIIIPNKLYGSLIFYDDYKTIKEWREDHDQPITKFYTGIPEVDNTYNVTSDMFDYRRPATTTGHKNKTWLEVITVGPKNARELIKKLEPSFIYQAKNLITFDAYNPFSPLEWELSMHNMPNNKIYTSLFLGEIKCSELNNTKYILNTEGWYSRFDILNKSSDILCIKFDEEELVFIFDFK